MTNESDFFVMHRISDGEWNEPMVAKEEKGLHVDAVPIPIETSGLSRDYLNLLQADRQPIQ